MKIIDGRQHFNASLEEVARGGHIAKRAASIGHQLAPLSDVSNSPPLLARVHRNIWIVDCPDCRSAEVGWINESLFMCSACFNAMVGGKWRRVVFPENRPQIEAVLKARPMPINRNWSPGETVTGLKRENREHGLPEGARSSIGIAQGGGPCRG